MTQRIEPEWHDGVGYCHDGCPQHDGKRCRLLGSRAPEGHVCEPWAQRVAAAAQRVAVTATPWRPDSEGHVRTVDGGEVIACTVDCGERGWGWWTALPDGAEGGTDCGAARTRTETAARAAADAWLRSRGVTLEER